MRSNLMQLITRNWPIKGAAVFLALMLYVAVQLQQPVTTSFDVTLNVLLPRGRALVHKPPKVRVQISGKGSQILKLRSLSGDITRRVPDTLTASTWSIQLDPDEVELALPKGADVRVMEVRPSEITLALDSVPRKEPGDDRLCDNRADGDHQRLGRIHAQRADRYDAPRHRAPVAQAGDRDGGHGPHRGAFVRRNSGRERWGRDHELHRYAGARVGVHSRSRRARAGNHSRFPAGRRAHHGNERRRGPDHGHRAPRHHRSRHSRFGHAAAPRHARPPAPSWLTPSSASRRRATKRLPPFS